MEVFHVGDKVFLDDMKYKYYKKIDIDTEGNQKLSVEDIDCKYGKIIAIDIEDNLMGVSPINDKFGIIFNVNIFAVLQMQCPCGRFFQLYSGEAEIFRVHYTYKKRTFKMMRMSL